MDSKSDHYLHPKQSLQKRQSSEAIEAQGSKKRKETDGATSHAAVSSVGMINAQQDSYISADEEDRSQFEPEISFQALQKQRIYREPNRPREDTKSTWGRCCQCEASGEIMSWPKCRSCFHNRCRWCEYSEGISVDGGETVKELTPLTPLERISRTNELSAEIGLELEQLSSDDASISQTPIWEIWEALRYLNESISQLEGSTPLPERKEEEEGTVSSVAKSRRC